MCSRTRLDLELAIASHSFILLAIERNRNRAAEDWYISVGLKIPMQARSAEPKVLYMGVLHKCCDSFFVHGLLDTDTVAKHVLGHCKPRKRKCYHRDNTNRIVCIVHVIDLEIYRR